MGAAAAARLPRLWLLLLIAAPHPHSTTLTPPEPPPCPCAEGCRPLSPQPRHVDEVVAFPTANNSSQWRSWDWEKITAVAPFGGHLPQSPDEQQMYCHAHARGVRVLGWTSCGPTLCCAVDEFYGWLVTKDRTKLNRTKDRDGFFTLNRTLVSAWAQSTAECIARAGLDGVLLDLEDVGGHQWPGVDSMGAIAFGVCELRRWLNQTVPGSLVAWTTEDSRLADYGAIAEAGCVDFYLEMEYGDAREMSAVENTISCYLNSSTPGIPGCDGDGFGVPPQHAGLMLSWSGCDYECEHSGCSAVKPWKKGDPRVPFPWGSDDARPACLNSDASPWIGEVFQYLSPNRTGATSYNATAQLKSFEWSAADGSRHSITYDDEDTLGVKYGLVKSAGMRAIGMWGADTLHGSELAARIWSGVPTPRKDPRWSDVSRALKADDGAGPMTKRARMVAMLGSRLKSTGSTPHDPTRPPPVRAREAVGQCPADIAAAVETTGFVPVRSFQNATATDDAPAVRAAINATKACPGTVFFSPGASYKLRSTVVIGHGDGPLALQGGGTSSAGLTQTPPAATVDGPGPGDFPKGGNSGPAFIVTQTQDVHFANL